MSEKCDKQKNATGQVAAVAASGMAATAAAGANTLAVFWAMFPAAVGMCIWAGFEWREQRAKRWWRQFVESSDKTTEELQGIIEANVGEPWVRETILESVRRLLESVCDESAEVLGSLSAEYLRGKRPPDAFFRGTARLAADLDARELSELRELVRDLHDVPVSHFTVQEMLVGGERRARVLFHTVAILGQAEAESPRDPTDERYRDVPSPASYYRLCHLLKVNQLAKDGVGGVMDTQNGPHVMVAERAVFRRLCCHLVGTPAANTTHR